MSSTRSLIATMMLLALASAAAARPPRAELAGIRLGMPEEEAQARLSSMGTRTAENQNEREEGEQESWSLKHGPWGYVAFGVEEGRVHWVTLFARPEGPRVRYRDLGSLSECRRTGTYFFIWKVPAKGDAASYTVIARGTDSVHVASVSLVSSHEQAFQGGGTRSDPER